MVTVLRGTSLDNFQQNCGKKCTEYLWGKWLSVGSDHIIVKRLSGGFTNQLYHCSLPDSIPVDGDEPREVVIKFYGQKHFKSGDPDLDDDQRFTDGIISCIVAANQLAPKMYGVFESGLIMEYIEHRRFARIDQTDHTLVSELSRKLATFHSLSAPIKRNTGDWFLLAARVCWERARQRFPDLDQLIADNNLDTLREHDLIAELDCVERSIKASRMPKVFCHNDFRGGNIMIRLSDSAAGNRLTVCDLENARYGYRGIDFACIFGEWERDCGDFGLYCRAVVDGLNQELFDEFPPFLSDQSMREFIAVYVSELRRICADFTETDAVCLVNQILVECKLCSLLLKLFTVLAFLQQNEGPGGYDFDKVLTLKFANYYFGHYFHLKHQFNEDNSISNYIYL